MDRPSREQIAKARASAYRVLAMSKPVQPEYREMLETFLRHTALISDEEIAHAMVATSQGEEVAKKPDMIAFALHTLKSGTQLSAGYIKDVVNYLYAGRP